MEYLASFVVTNIFFIFSMSYICDKKIDLKKGKLYLGYFLTIVLSVTNYEFSSLYLRLIFNIIIFVIAAKVIFSVKWKNAALLGILVTALGMLSELFYALLAGNYIDKILFSTDSPYSVLLNNIMIGIFLILICYLLPTKKIYSSLLESVDRIKSRKILLVCFLIVFIVNLCCIITYLVYNKTLNVVYLPLYSVLLSLLMIIFVFAYLKTSNDYIKIYEKYTTSLKSIEEFELSLENYKVTSHENRNQFKTIRNMSRDSKIVKYIDNLLNEKVNDDNQILYYTQKIPQGGLRGIIYSKMLTMKQKNMDFELVVDKKITTKKINDIDSKTITDICNILGVFLDNAIEASEKLKNPYVLVELYEEDKNIVISVSNNYEGYVDLDNIEKCGITSKGKGHGYGLALVKYIIEKNKKITHSCELIEDNFMQIIKIKV